ncbi:sulfatase-like hydrolase/transferase [Arthrobacter psychrochitiniphilus]|uniref:Phosphodiesterase n=1 Tax=Arthrobacter psychrochitiniphilus TaxID=291045 RepID=A0A2V3DY73_9MICC|nr:sulfatase-like hydrolase/transferase [Arthrobacter psychrochitiniphilus]NYG16322.1 arylsulfatase A-like enzyme [Arthrobacter psychrochitiniphilus]PXA69512.1 phosphodiesterase [Arthrobacter psychrochitiniphilus]
MSKQTAAKAPNFIVVMTDDQGAWARGRTMPELITPVLDELGETGLELTRFFCTSPVCSPARASLVTGRMPSAHGVHDWLRSENSGVSTRGVHYLQDFATTPELLHEAGYTCAHSGKWHLGDARTPAPGFSHWYSHRDGGGSYFGAPVIADGKEQSEDGYITHAITKNAAAMLTELAQAEEPFYLQVHYTAPHSPWTDGNHPQEYVDLYKDSEFPSIPRPPAHDWFNWDHGDLAAAMRNPQENLAGFCAALTAVDRGVGSLLNILDDAGIRDDTYVIFTSDNGFSCGHHGIWGKGNGTTPLNVWDNSILVPFIINRPGTIVPRLDDTMTSAASLHATLLELAGAPAPLDPLIAGESMAPRFLNDVADADASAKDASRKDAIVIFDEYGGTRMIRTKSHKLVVRYGGAVCELYDLLADPQESRNEIDNPAFATRRQELQEQLTDWFAAHSEPRFDAFDRPVTGLGQTSPVWVPMADSQRYVEPGIPATPGA